MTGRTPPRGRDTYRHWAHSSIRVADENGAGHVDNAVYYVWCDTTVIGWLRARHLLEPGGPVVFIAENGCRYLHELTFPGEVEIGLAAGRIGTSSVTFQLGVFAEGADAPASEGEAVYVCIDRATRRPMPLPEYWRKALAGLTPAA